MKRGDGMKFTKAELDHIKEVYSKIVGTADFTDSEAKIVQSIFNKVSKTQTAN